MNKAPSSIKTFLVMFFFLVNVNTLSLTHADESATPTATPIAQEVTFPDLTGPFKVGRTQYEWVDQNRDETSASIPGLKRDLMVYIWYPADVTKRSKPVSYMDGNLTWDIWSKHPGLEASVQIHAYSNPHVAGDKPSYPIIIFVPGAAVQRSNLDVGLSGLGLNYASIIEEIASYGYIVVATSHPYSSSVIDYPDGRLVTRAHSGKSISASMDLVDVWTQDVRFVLDQIEKLNMTDKTFKDHLDLAHVGILGHIIGGTTAVEAAAVDPRIQAGINLEGFNTPDFIKDLSSKALADKPFLFVGSYYGTPNDSEKTHDKFWLQFTDINVDNYGDIGLLIPLLPEFSAAPLLGHSDPIKAIQIINSYVLAFFNHYLGGQDMNWPSYSNATLQSLDPAGAPTK